MRLLSNKPHYSPTDPDARISLKPGKARALNYRCSLAVDTAKGVISHVQADLADSRDSLHLPRLLAGLQQRLRNHELRVRELLADAGYANGANYALLEAAHLTAWIPVFGQYKAEMALPTTPPRTLTPARRARSCRFASTTPRPTATGAKSIGPPVRTASSAR